MELPYVTTVPTAEDEKHSRFSIYHWKISHSTMDFYVLRYILDMCLGIFWTIRNKRRSSFSLKAMWMLIHFQGTRERRYDFNDSIDV